MSHGTLAYQQATRDGVRLLLTPELSPEAAQLSGRWIATTTPAECRP